MTRASITVNPTPMKRILLVLLLGGALPAAAQTSAPMAAPAAAPLAHRPPPDTHGVDMRTQAGPPGARYSPPFPLDPQLPNFWLIGDSTVRNGTAGDGTNLNQWGWGAPLTFYFDPRKVNVVNRALGGTSARSFYNNNWKKLVGLIRPGDVVIMQFGTNDGGEPTRSVGELSGIGEETRDITNRAGQPETIHAFGWYLRQMIAETRARQATPVVCSLIPRKSWDEAGHIKRTHETFEGWTEEVARQAGVGFIDLNELIGRAYDKMTRTQVDLIYVPNPTPAKPRGETVHTGWAGAVLNAEIVVSGLKALPDDPVAAYFSARGLAVAPASAAPSP
jgi:lysophospholipase L1-like esterase